MGKLQGKIALITGGYSGIGGAAAKLFAAEGAQVIIVGRNMQKGRAFIDKLLKINVSMEFIACDVTKKEQIIALKNRVASQYKRLDILFNNAGILKTDALEEITDEDWDAVYNANVKSILYMCQMFIPLLRGG